MFNKILIANRGEIACRVIETAHKMGIRCVAVYSEADVNARHVAMADEAFLLGPAPSNQSYLRHEKIIEIALASDAQAIHPGYGFLSENTEFAEACAENGLVFIGPPASAIAAMGSKSAAKAIMEKAQVPLVPGYHGDDQSPELLKEEAIRCGFPVLLKAIAGGGGKGMRVVNELAEFDEALAAAQRESSNAFGNPDMLIERYLTQPRHVEIQVFCDAHGNGVYLAERDCSVQRRHQKVIEEAPAPGLSDATRKAMGEAAVKAAQAIDYVGAGTVEFLYDVDASFFFMEMNTRLQVEHPVTEMITGQDLVEWQLRIANGEALPLSQDQIQITGHALEARIYAEDPDNDFLPATGKLHYLKTPATNSNVRVDTGVLEGDEVSIHYDPMIAKLIVWDQDRSKAINRMVQALEQYRISGVTSNIRFLHALVDAKPFRDAELDTGFIEKHENLLFNTSSLELDKALVLAAGFYLQQAKVVKKSNQDKHSPFSQFKNWRMNRQYQKPLILVVDDTKHTLEIQHFDEYDEVRVDGRSYKLQSHLSHDKLDAIIDGHCLSVHGALKEGVLDLFYQGEKFNCHQYTAEYEQGDHGSDNSLSAPMNGSMVSVMVSQGDKVSEGQTLVIMEAMKMEHAIKAPHDGIIDAIYFDEGELVSDGAELLAMSAIETPQESVS